MPHLDPYFKQVDSLQDKFIERLREAVAIPSISSEDERRPDVVKASHLIFAGATEGTV
jgi:Cys-Gly metallodipeptidase DUG1